MHFFHQRIRSFGYAFQGVGWLFKTQVHAWIHLVATLVVVGLGWYFSVETLEWCILIGCITLVFTAEAFNTALEFLTDLASPEYHPLAGKAKDVAAAAVLLAAIGSIVIAGFIFCPRLLS